jgi:riboflavin synthase
MGQTLKMSALGMLNTGDCVNLERAMLPTSRMGGHIVQGHVDAVGSIVSRDKHENWEVVRISLPVSIAHYVVERGSIAVNGVSLTVSAVDTNNQWFEVSLIPTTLNETTLGAAEVGSSVNLESDVIARHVEKMMQR